ncbi:TPA: hypothetical protein ACTNR9_004649, partial [Salmonella enterica subsp. enterica serovar Enteritidis]
NNLFITCPVDRFQRRMPALAADSRPRRFGNNISTSRRDAPGPGHANSYNILTNETEAKT